MDTKKIELLLTAANVGSLKKTAEMLFYAQSGLIYAINMFEKDIGISLTRRTPKGITFTREGETLKPYLEDILSATKRFESKVMELQSIQSLSIGVWPSIARNWVLEYVTEFKNSHPSVDIHINIADVELSTMLKVGSIDCAIGPYHISGDSNAIHLIDNEVYVCVPYDAPFPDDVPVPLQALSEYQIVLPPHLPQGPGAKQFEEWCNSIPASNKLQISSADGSALLSLVGRGGCVTFQSEMYMHECPDQVRMLPVDPILLSQTIIATSPIKPISPMLREFIKSTQEYVNSNVKLK